MQSQSCSQLPLVDQELKRVYLFAGLNTQQLEKIKQSMRHLLLAEGESLFEQGQRAERFFLVREGHIKLLRLSLEGSEKVFEVIAPTQTFAEAIMFMPNSIYPVSAQAIEPTSLLTFENRIFVEILKESSDTCFRLMFHMSRRIRHWINEVDNLTLQNATYRLISYILYHIPNNHQDSYEFNLPIPKQVIASRLSIKPETFSRILNSLCQEGLLTVTGRTIHIHQVEKLRLYGQSALVPNEHYEITCRDGLLSKK
ncbi:transcriptional regulator, Crp/Fnr family [Thioploca ingrica]|uniref:Transcriptional regulator, Crp/Fnr family n=1 Tax=Thioploca ingrica TaxID=40754 RepID=A0A090AKA9_9GAMM|nr:transcriptional regulator, Crp/Fnr family [Thioploca ingrica]